MKAKVAIRAGVLMAAVITLLTAVGAYLAVLWDTNAPYLVVAVGTAATCFFGLLILTQTKDEEWVLTEETMRTAIAGTIVVVYLVLVGIVAFFVVGPTNLPGITQTMVTNFTTIVGIVIAFYFGASAYVQAQREKSDRSKANANEESKDATATPSGSSTT
jgi:hypothetical protein